MTSWSDRITVHLGPRGSVTRLELACLRAIDNWDDDSTSLNVAGEVYQLARDENGDRWVTEAQHIAVYRALASLRRKGWISGVRDLYGNRCCLWRRRRFLERLEVSA
jgi:hypothetical protein